METTKQKNVRRAERPPEHGEVDEGGRKGGEEPSGEGKECQMRGSPPSLSSKAGQRNKQHEKNDIMTRTRVCRRLDEPSLLFGVLLTRPFPFCHHS